MKNKLIKITASVFLIMSFVSCKNDITLTNNEQVQVSEDTTEVFSYINTDGETVETRFNTPEGYKRERNTKNSWGKFLQTLPMKPHGTEVSLYNGFVKNNYSAYMAVVDLPIGDKDLHQCADAVMRLRADYLYSQGRYNEIEFLFCSGKKSNYSSWLGGRTPNKTNFWSYLENVFSFASTLSLDRQLKSKDVKDLEIGDVFIKGGSPGHAVIVVDKCVNSKGEVKFMLAQSYMPAQEIQILVNPDCPESPWYDANFGSTLYSAEWTFTSDQLKTF
jgi:hypothetical protein